MIRESGWLFPNTTVETVLKTRPGAMALLEAHGCNPWKSLGAPIAELCAGSGLEWAVFSRELGSLPIPGESSDWKSLPMYRLLDFLVDQHRDLLQGFLPAIGHVLSSLGDADAESLLHIRGLAEEWPAFASSLSAHIREEEEILFLRTLRYDSCLRTQSADPEFAGGSVQVFTVVRMLEHEHRDMALFRGFLSRALPGFPEAGGKVVETRLRPLIAGLQETLGRHSRLETDLLFPWAIRLEKTLYDQRIRGQGEAQGSARMVCV